VSSAFAAVHRAHVQAVYVLGDALFNAHRKRFVKLAAKTQLPTFYAYRVYVDDGGLISYGPSFKELFRRSAGYVDTH